MKKGLNLNKTAPLTKTISEMMKDILKADHLLTFVTSEADMKEPYQYLRSGLKLTQGIELNLENITWNMLAPIDDLISSFDESTAFLAGKTKYPNQTFKADIDNLLTFSGDIMKAMSALSAVDSGTGLKEIQDLRKNLAAGISAAKKALSNASLHGEHLKKATKMKKTLTALHIMVQTVTELAGKVLLKSKIKPPKIKSGEVVVDKYGKKHAPGSLVSYKQVTKKVYGLKVIPQDSVIKKISNGTKQTLTPGNSAEMRKKAIAAIKAQALMNKDADYISNPEIPFPLPIGAVVDPTIISVIAAGTLADIEPLYAHMTATHNHTVSLGIASGKTASMLHIIQDMVKHKIYKQNSSFDDPNGKTLLEIVDAPSPNHLAIKLRHTHLANGVSPNDMHKLFIEMMESIGWHHAKIDKNGQQSAEDYMSTGGAYTYYAFEPQLNVDDEKAALNDNKWQNSLNDKNALLTMHPDMAKHLRSAIGTTYASHELTIPEYEASYETTVIVPPAGVLGGLNVGDAHRSRTEGEAHQAKEAKSYFTSVSGNSDQIRAGAFKFKRYAVETKHTDYRFGSDEAKAAVGLFPPDSRMLHLSFQVMGELKKSIGAAVKSKHTDTHYTNNKAAKALNFSQLPTWHAGDHDEWDEFKCITGTDFIDSKDIVSNLQTTYKPHKQTFREIVAPFGIIHVNEGVLHQKWVNGDWDGVEVYFDEAAVKGKTHAQMLQMVGEYLETDLGASGSLDALTSERTEDDNERMRLAYARKFCQAGKAVANIKAGGDSTNHNRFDKSVNIDKEDNATIIADTLTHMAKETKFAQEAVKNMSNITMPNIVKTLDFNGANEDTVKAAVLDAFDNVYMEHDECVGSRGVIPDAHIMLAAGRYGAGATFGVSSAAAVSVLGMYGDEATGGTISTDGDYKAHGSSGVNYAVYQSKGQLTEHSISFDLSYIERARDFHAGDAWGSQNGSNSNYHKESRYHQQGYEALFEGSAARCISSIKMSDYNSQGAAAQKRIDDALTMIRDDLKSKGNKTYAWELLSEHPDIFLEYADELHALGFLENKDEFPAEGFEYKGFLVMTKAKSQKNQHLMSTIIAKVRESQAKERGAIV